MSELWAAKRERFDLLRQETSRNLAATLLETEAEVAALRSRAERAERERDEARREASRLERARDLAVEEVGHANERANRRGHERDAARQEAGRLRDLIETKALHALDLAEGALRECRDLADKYRSDWSDFDGRTLKGEIYLATDQAYVAVVATAAALSPAAPENKEKDRG